MSSSEAIAVGVVGLGDMGSGIAESILRAGILRRVFDLRPAAVGRLVDMGAQHAERIADMTADCDVVCLVVLDDAQVRSVCAEIAAAPGRVKAVVVHSTVLPTTVIAVGAELDTVGVRLADAPVTGGGERGRLGTLTVIVGADDETFDLCSPVFEAIGEHVFHVGPVGAGSAGKLVNNLLSLGGLALNIEAMRLASAYGIDEETATEFITFGAGDSRGIRTWGRFDRLRRTHTLAGTPQVYEFYSKDLRSAAVAAGHQSVTLPITAVIGELLGPMMAARDSMLDDLGPLPTPQLCRGCNQDLAKAYRDVGFHPECRPSVNNPRAN